ncbi:hypothetical protein GQ457_18G017660 [Hibiscus cannabinus]
MVTPHESVSEEVNNTRDSNASQDTHRLFSSKKINVVLDDNNYLLWHQQVFLTIKTHKLLKFIDSNVSPPPEYVTKDGQVSINPEFEVYEEQDGALASWLLSTVSEGVLPHLIGINTASGIWQTLHRIFSGKTTSRLMYFRRLLHTQKKGELSMKEFLLKVKTIRDNLASCGEHITEHEHVTAILNGLPPEYDSIITVLTAGNVAPSVNAVSTILLDSDARQSTLHSQILACAHISNGQHSVGTAGASNGVFQQPVAATDVSNSVLISSPTTSNTTHAEYSQNPSYSSSGHDGSSYSSRGRGRGRSGRPQCQLCGRMGHLVEICYFRFDMSFKNEASRNIQNNRYAAPTFSPVQAHTVTIPSVTSPTVAPYSSFTSPTVAPYSSFYCAAPARPHISGFSQSVPMSQTYPQSHLTTVMHQPPPGYSSSVYPSSSPMISNSSKRLSALFPCDYFSSRYVHSPLSLAASPSHTSPSHAALQPSSTHIDSPPSHAAISFPTSPSHAAIPPSSIHMSSPPSHAAMSFPTSTSHAAIQPLSTHIDSPPSRAAISFPTSPSHAAIPPSSIHMSSPPSHAAMSFPTSTSHAAIQPLSTHIDSPPSHAAISFPTSPSHAALPPSSIHMSSLPSHAAMSFPTSTSHAAIQPPSTHIDSPPSLAALSSPSSPSHAALQPSSTHMSSPPSRAAISFPTPPSHAALQSSSIHMISPPSRAAISFPTPPSHAALQSSSIHMISPPSHAAISFPTSSSHADIPSSSIHMSSPPSHAAMSFPTSPSHAAIQPPSTHIDSSPSLAALSSPSSPSHAAIPPSSIHMSSPSSLAALSSPLSSSHAAILPSSTHITSPPSPAASSSIAASLPCSSSLIPSTGRMTTSQGEEERIHLENVRVVNIVRLLSNQL